MEAIAVVTILSLMQFYFFGLQVGQMRAKHGIKAPATTGHPEFERMFRVQQNTLEQLIMFVPALWIFAYFSKPLVGAAIGMVFIISRYLFKRGYVAEAGKRSLGFSIGAVCTAVLLLGGLIHAGHDSYVRYLQ
ncbi:MAG: MAPEG family protein [Woeseiaceae bacterium]|nr:MAPEG family protein [Woeseiaceae bacterium]